VASGSGIAAAKADYAKWLSPTAWGYLPKLKSRPPRGKKIIVVACAGAGCLPEPLILKNDVAPILGWTVQILQSGLTPTSNQATMSQAVADKPDGIYVEGLTSQVLQKQISTAKAEHIPVVIGETSDTQDPPYFTNVPGLENPSYKLQAAMMAAAVVADTNGGAKVAFVNFPGFTIYQDVIGPDFRAAFKNYCPSCELKELDLPLTEAATAPTQIVNFVRGNPELNTVVNVLDPTNLGLPTALSGAGLAGKIKVFGFYPNPPNVPLIKSGQEMGGVMAPYYEQQFEIANRFAAIFTGSPLQPTMTAVTPQVLVTKSNLSSTGHLNYVYSDNAAKFKAIWNIG
jgi:ribose transport system substrate-binding protein